MTCFGCGGEGFTIGGYCSECRPLWHRQNGALREFYSACMEEFKQLTGKDAFEDWDGYEQFLERKAVRISS